MVRVVSIGGDWSKELCAGTHVPETGTIGLVSVLGEASIGSGVRRIDALVGQGAYAEGAKERALVSQISRFSVHARTSCPTASTPSCPASRRQKRNSSP